MEKTFEVSELDEDSTCKEFLQVQTEVNRQIKRHTEAELIMQIADATKDNMRRTTFEGAIVRKKDVDIAKNYLNEEKMSELKLQQSEEHIVDELTQSAKNIKIEKK